MDVELERPADVRHRLERLQGIRRAEGRGVLGDLAGHVRVYHGVLRAQRRGQDVAVPERDRVDGEPQLVPLGAAALAARPLVVAALERAALAIVVDRLEPALALALDAPARLRRAARAGLEH